MKYRTFFRSEEDIVRLTKQYSDMASFIALFMGKRMYHMVSSRKWSQETTERIVRKANEINELVNEIGGIDDMNSIIDLTFFEMLQRYDSKGKVRKELKKKKIDYDLLTKREQKKYEKEYPEVGFEGYLFNVFKWRLFKNIELETKGVIPGIGWCKSMSTNLGGHDSDMDTENVNVAEYESSDDTETLDIIDSDMHIDYSWIEGDTCMYPFNELSVQDRYILKMRFVDHMSPKEIANSVGVSPSVIRSRYNEIVQKIADGLGPEWISMVYADSHLGTDHEVDRSEARKQLLERFFNNR